jgi:hypothetical protein
MRSQKRRVEKIEASTMDKKEDAPDSLGELYAEEDDPESDMHKAMEALYNPNRSTVDPNKAI